MSKEFKQLSKIVAEIIHDHDDEIAIAPRFIARKALLTLDPTDSTMRKLPLVYKAAHQALQQIARQLLRAHFVDEEDADEAHPFIPGLQKRYPASPWEGDEPRYLLLEHLSDQDVSWNVARLRREGGAKLMHAARLEDWGAKRAVA